MKRKVGIMIHQSIRLTLGYGCVAFVLLIFYIFVSFLKEIVFLLLSKKFEDNLKAVCKCFQRAFKFTGSRVAV